MSDIFISYARADKDRAELLAEAFSRQGWSVWWDREIPPGKSFDETIENALNSARCVIVLWSKDSVSSRWVKTEAAEGAARGILVPVLIDKVRIPLEFKRIEAADLFDWRGDSPHSEFDLIKDRCQHPRWQCPDPNKTDANEYKITVTALVEDRARFGVSYGRHYYRHDRLDCGVIPSRGF